MLWSADLKLNTIHSRDWCDAAWVAASWCMKRSRAEANAEAGEDLPRISPQDKTNFQDFNADQDVERCCPRSKTVKAAVFNVVDDGNTDQYVQRVSDTQRSRELLTQLCFHKGESSWTSSARVSIASIDGRKRGARLAHIIVPRSFHSVQRGDWLHECRHQPLGKGVCSSL
jgi:hypothetical protein